MSGSQHGVNVIAWGLNTQVKEFTVGGQYAYKPEPGMTLKDYNIEQQADIARDDFIAIQRADSSKIERFKVMLGNFPAGY